MFFKKYLIDLMVDVLVDSMDKMVSESSNTIDDKVAASIKENKRSIKKAIKGAL